MAPKKDTLSAPLSSTTSVVARIVHAFAALTLNVNAGNGQDVEMSLQDGRKILEYAEILLERTSSSVVVCRRLSSSVVVPEGIPSCALTST